MRKRVLKSIALVLMIIFISSGVSCSKKADNNSTKSGNTKDEYDKIPMEISAEIFDRGQVLPEEGSYEENRWTKYINENSGVKVTWVPVLRTQTEQKLNSLIAVGQAPDLMWDYGTNFLLTRINQNVIQPIDEYIEKYSTSYKAYIKAHPELLPYVTKNGKMYAVTSKRGIDVIANHGMVIRKDWLDELGLKMPTTDEELLKVAEAFKNNDPDGNGKNDTYGFAYNYNLDGIIQAFYNCINYQWYIENGKVKYGTTLDRYKEVLAFRKKLFEEGLIEKDPGKSYENEKQLWINGKAGIYMGGYAPPYYRDFKKNNPNAVVEPLESVSTKYGRNGLYQEPPANRLIVFNKNMKNPKAAVKLLDWMIDKGWFTIMFGVAGQNYKMVDGLPKAIDADKNQKELQYSTEYALINNWDPKPEAFKIMSADDPIAKEEADLKGRGIQVAMKNVFRRDIPYAPTFDDLLKGTNEKFQFSTSGIINKVITGGSQYTPEWGMEQIQAKWSN